MSEYVKKIVADEAAKVKDEIKGGTFYGEPIDMTDPDVVLVTAVWKARHDEQVKAAKSMDVIRGLWK